MIDEPRRRRRTGDAAPADATLRPPRTVAADEEAPVEAVRAIANAGTGERDVIALWFGESDRITPKFINDAAKRALENAQQLTGLPTVDPVRYGPEAIATELIRRLDERKPKIGGEQPDDDRSRVQPGPEGCRSVKVGHRPHVAEDPMQTQPAGLPDDRVDDRRGSCRFEGVRERDAQVVGVRCKGGFHGRSPAWCEGVRGCAGRSVTKAARNTVARTAIPAPMLKATGAP